MDRINRNRTVTKRLVATAMGNKDNITVRMENKTLRAETIKTGLGSEASMEMAVGCRRVLLEYHRTATRCTFQTEWRMDSGRANFSGDEPSL